MYGTCLSGKRKLFESETSRLGIKIASILATVINAEVAKTEASFLASRAIDI